MVDFVTGLRCRECRARLPRRGAARLRLLLRAARGGLRLRADRRHRQPGAHRGRPPLHLALPGPAAGRRRHAGRPRRRLHPAGAGRPPGRRARAGRAVDQGRHGQPHRLLQGPGGLGGADQGPPARLQGGRLRLDGQPGQLGGGPRRPGRHGLGRPHPPRPRDGQGHHDRRLRGHGDRRRGELRRRQPAVRRADERAPELGLRQRQRAHLLRRGLQDAGLRDRRAAGLAGPGPRRGPHRLGQPADQGGQGLRRAGQGRACCPRSPPCGSRAPRPRAARPVATAFLEGTDAIRPVKPKTIAKSLAIGNPADGWYALEVMRRSGRLVRRGDRRRGASRPSGCWPAPRGSSPRPPAG